MKNKKGSRRNRNKKSAAHNNPQLVVDRFTKLPDDLLLNILDRLNTPDAVRTCLLSKRTIHLRHMLSRFQISVDSFVPDCGYATLKDTIPMNAAVADATDSILNFRRQDIPLRHLSVCFYLKYYDCLTIGKAVARAMATNNLLDSVEFIILPEKKPEHYSTYDLRHNGKQLMRFFGACTDAFAGLTRLYLRNLKLGETDIPNIIATCKLLEYLRLSFCETEDSVLQLQVEHPRLVELDIYHASLELVELNYLPNLKHLDFSLWVCPHEPLSFGNVPLLSSLSLTNVAMRYQEVIRLSHFLANVPNISDLYLNFGSEKIWVQPECPKLLAPVLRNLQVLNLDELPEECDISWTCFFLEAAPFLKEMCATVWDHWCGMQTDKVEREEQGYSEKANVEWESSAPDGFRHYNLTKLTIYGFQPNENFLGYIRHIMEAAVNLEDVSLYDRKVLECCEDLDPKIKVAPSWYPQTIEEQELLRKQITEGLVMASPHNKKGSRRNRNKSAPVMVVDRFTTLPDDILLNILDRLNTPDAVRTCLLSKRTLHLPRMLSHFRIALLSFAPDPDYITFKDTIVMNAAVADATDNVLNFRAKDIPLRQLSICFYLKYYDCLTIGKAVARAMATHKLDSAEFRILTDYKLHYYTFDGLHNNGKRLMTFFGACTDAFAGLTRLYLQNLRLAETDIPNIIATCKRLESLRMFMCQTEGTVLQLQVEHQRLVELDICHGCLKLVKLNSLPKLERLVFYSWRHPQEPLYFGNVPQLSSLSLTNVGLRWHNLIRLSQFLSNVTSIRDLHLNFESERIWVQPECPKLLAPVLKNLQVLTLDDLPEGCDIAWTRFFLEAAPFLKELCITVWDHWCNIVTDKVEREEEGYCDKTNVQWESSSPDGFRHCNLVKLTIYGFQPDDNFLGYIRHIMETAVNIEEISLYDRKVEDCCEELDPKIKVAPSKYPQTVEEQELLRKQITEGLVMASPHYRRNTRRSPTHLIPISSTSARFRSSMKNKKGSRRNRNKSAASTGSLPLPVDRLTKLPDDVLLNILDRLNTPDVLANSAVADATDNVLSFRSQDVPLHRLSICFYLKYYDCLTIGKAVSQAMATYNQIDSVEFIILTELQPECYTVDDFRRNGKQFMTFLGSYLDAFAGLTQLFIQNLRLAEADIPNILSTCKRLQYLRMSVCDSEDSVLQLQLEHPRLVELDIYDAGFHLVDLKSLPNLKRLVFGMWVSPGEPLSFGNVPMLSSLSLNNVSAGYQEVFRLSHFLANVPNISNLHLSFASEKIWVKPECPKLLAPVLQKLRFGTIVWNGEELGYRDKTNVEWQSSQPDGFKHHNLVKLIIYGFQPDDNFVGYIRCMMEAAVNLVRISLYDRRFSDCCSDLDPKIKIKVALSRFPRTIKQQELVRRKITEGFGIASSDIIRFRS
uniref:F-box domain-containing protein n=1 Tax=Oryza nivara TaxID=4536 RepID=A0A0E0GF57_ORYNI